MAPPPDVNRKVTTAESRPRLRKESTIRPKTLAVSEAQFMGARRFGGWLVIRVSLRIGIESKRGTCVEFRIG